MPSKVSKAQLALDDVMSTLKNAPPLTRAMFNIPEPMAKPWQHALDVPVTVADPRIDTSGTTLTPDGLMAAKTQDDFVWTDGRGACGRTLVSVSVAEKMGMPLPPRRERHAATTRSDDEDVKGQIHLDTEAPLACDLPVEPAVVVQEAASAEHETAAIERETTAVEQEETAGVVADHDSLSSEQTRVEATAAGPESTVTHSTIAVDDAVPQAGGSAAAAAAESLKLVAEAAMQPTQAPQTGASADEPDKKVKDDLPESDAPAVEVAKQVEDESAAAESDSLEKNENVEQTPATPPPYIRHRIPPGDLPEVLFVRARWRLEGASCDRGVARADADDDEPDAHTEAEERTMVYIRVLPGAPPPFSMSPSEQPQVGFAHIEGGYVGRGNSGTVWNCSFAPSLSSSDSSPGLFRAVAKLATTTGGYSWDRVQQFTVNEAQTYCALPEWMSADMDAYAIVPPLARPQKACAIVPKFYGLYVRADDIRASLERQVKTAANTDTVDQDDESAMKWTFSKLRQPLMLMEHCGAPINPYRLTAEDKKQVYSMVMRLHRAGFMQCSPYERNFLVRAEQNEDGTERKVFRIVDFGRGTTVSRRRWSVENELFDVQCMLAMHSKGDIIAP